MHANSAALSGYYVSAQRWLVTGNKESMLAYAKLLAERGVGVVNVEYSTVPTQPAKALCYVGDTLVDHPLSSCLEQRK
ncbi:hypothetical protein HH682_11615 [Rosenbergiella sp. S61]|uniref:Uncharacterized protein n=1 Tax=Rosenbergiella gaditana TaxID=2726987 RepID=A0ABS5SY68_9GAMM|nr:hypothetical protein [Rosenbergiella gaditana]MBT0725050.1 hypothetical protein [Rosenbergiella gaditana]